MENSERIKALKDVDKYIRDNTFYGAGLKFREAVIDLGNAIKEAGEQSIKKINDAWNRR